MNDKKQQLEKLREQEQIMYREIDRLENEIAAEASFDILARIKECKFEITDNGNAIMDIDDGSRLWEDIMGCGRGYYHFEFVLSSDS